MMLLIQNYDQVSKRCWQSLSWIVLNQLTFVSGLYNLFAALAEVLNAEMAPVLPKIVNRMLDSVKSTDDILPEFKEDDGVAEIGDHVEIDETGDIDIENSDDEDDDDDDEFTG